MAAYDYDLFVIGGGSGGVRAARIAAGHGANGLHRVQRFASARGDVNRQNLTLCAAHVHDSCGPAPGRVEQHRPLTHCINVARTLRCKRGVHDA